MRFSRACHLTQLNKSKKKFTHSNQSTPATGSGMVKNADDMYIETLVTASHECVRCCELLQQVVLQLPLTSPIAPEAHRMMWTIGNVETALHQFIDRELLHEPYARRRENGGARLQDAIESARGSLKPTVKASLLAGGEGRPIPYMRLRTETALDEPPPPPLNTRARVHPPHCHQHSPRGPCTPPHQASHQCCIFLRTSSSS